MECLKSAVDGLAKDVLQTLIVFGRFCKFSNRLVSLGECGLAKDAMYSTAAC